ncbi:MAG: DNA gyrase subunit A [Chromatiales bacterium]|nr:DNA gyrase subunit A [Chromatiales bacterium]
MADFASEVLPIALEDEMRQSYLDYAMSVIVGRALPDARDGLKPVHRRILFSMHENNNSWNRPYVKCARVVGDVLGKYHPHGDTATYEALVRMAQDFSMRYVLVDGQGNFGSVDGDSPAAYRYTECRMTRLASELLADIDRETVDFVPNYDGKENEPTVLPARVPNLLVNGASGIAVGMATNIPPHNLGEVIDATLALIDDPDIDLDGLMAHVPGPDFPTAGIINGARGIREAYRTGRGRIYVRARTGFETEDSGRERIVVHELPYQVNKARLIKNIADLVKDKRITGISEIRDESDKDGMRVAIDLKRGEVPDVVLNNLFQHTQMQTVFGINMVALLGGQPRLLTLKDMLEAFLRHRREVVTRRTLYELRKARERAHVLEGLAVALANIDEVIALIKAAAGPAEAKQALLDRAWPPGVVTEMLARAGATASRPDDLPTGFGLGDAGYRLSDTQAQAILDLRLQKLTGLEQENLLKEYREILVRIADLLDILQNPDRLIREIRGELASLREQYADARRTEIVVTQQDLSIEDLITDEDAVVTFSHSGYAKRQPLDAYRAQRRGGRGRTAATTKEDDFIEQMFVAATHDTLLCFSSRGKAYWLKVYELPQAGPNARGKPMVNLLPLDEGERISAVLPLREYPQDEYVVMASRAGVIKKTPLQDFSRPRANGIIACDLREGDELVGVARTDGRQQLMLCTSAGKAVRFEESDVRPMGRTACGVRGIRLGDDQEVVALIIGDDSAELLTATVNGYGKRTPMSEFPTHRRGGQGVIAIRTSDRNGRVVGAVRVVSDDELMLISDGGTLVRTRVADVSVQGRASQGVRLIRLAETENLIGLARVDCLEVDDADADGDPDPDVETEPDDAADPETEQ